MAGQACFSIRPAGVSDARAVRMLLPAESSALSYCLIAESGDPPQIIGAAGITQVLRPRPLAGPGVAVHVIPPYRRHGVAGELIQKVAQYAAESGAQAIYATQKVDSNSEEQQAWEALGFSVCETVLHHELPLIEFEVQLTPLLNRMQERGKIPASAKIIPLCDADIEAVLRLHLEELGGDPADLRKKLRGEVPNSFSARYSRILLVNGQTVGFILAHRAAQDIAYVDANVIAPEFRGRWANVWLKLEATQGAQQLGIKKFVFTSFDHYTDTRSFTDRFQGATVSAKLLMYRPLLHV